MNLSGDSNLIIEKAMVENSPIIIELLTSLYVELGEEAESLSYLSKKLITDIINSGKTEIYLVKTNSEIAAIFTLTESQAIYANGKYGSLDEMFVKPAFRSKNIGSSIIRHIILTGKLKNWSRVDVTAPTEDKWERTVSFYKRCGFIFTGPKFKINL